MYQDEEDWDDAFPIEDYTYTHMHGHAVPFASPPLAPRFRPGDARRRSSASARSMGPLSRRALSGLMSPSHGPTSPAWPSRRTSLLSDISHLSGVSKISSVLPAVERWPWVVGKALVSYRVAIFGLLLAFWHILHQLGRRESAGDVHESYPDFDDLPTAIMHVLASLPLGDVVLKHVITLFAVRIAMHHLYRSMLGAPIKAVYDRLLAGTVLRRALGILAAAAAVLSGLYSLGRVLWHDVYFAALRQRYPNVDAEALFAVVAVCLGVALVYMSLLGRLLGGLVAAGLLSLKAFVLYLSTLVFVVFGREPRVEWVRENLGLGSALLLNGGSVALTGFVLIAVLTTVLTETAESLRGAAFSPFD